MAEPEPRGINRRTALIGGGALIGAAAIGTGVVVARTLTTVPETAAFGVNQAGVARPETPQRHGLLSVFDFTDRDEPDFLVTLHERLGQISAAIVVCTSSTDFESDVTPAGPGDVTITVGLGPLAVTAIDPTLPGATDLPAFLDDELIADNDRGGDLLVAVHASDKDVVQAVADRVIRDLAGLSPRWHQHGQRAAGEGTVTRNPLGHKDGIIVPRGDEELAENVWLTDERVIGGTICVVRRLRLRVADFRSEPISRQDEIIGRHKIDGSPLSGGGPDATINVNAKTAEGTLLIPPRSHVRAAHPSFTGSALMLRRGYGFSNGADDAGLLFVCFQHDLDTFVKSQLRIDELDDLRQYMTATASATFLILPGFTEGSDLGQTLFAR